MSENNKISPFAYINLYPGEHIKLMYTIPGLIDVKENRYYITDFGRVFSLYPNRNNGDFLEMSPGTSKDGYSNICVRGVINENNTYRISRLVLYYFDSIPDDPSLYDANHKDYNRQNNRLDNLEWLTHVENIEYSNCNRDRITDEDMIDIFDRVHNKGQSCEEVAKIYNRSVRTISNVANGSDKYRERHNELDLPDMRKFVVMSEETIKQIYEELLEGNTNASLARKYDVSPDTISRIRLKQERYGEILKDYPDLERKTEKRNVDYIESLSGVKQTPFIYDTNYNNGQYQRTPITTIMAQNIYCELLDGVSNAELARKYNINPNVVTNIRLKKDKYAKILKNYPDLEEGTNAKFTKEEALAIHNEIVNTNLPNREICKKYNITQVTLNDLKFCKNSYSYLKDIEGIVIPEKGIVHRDYGKEKLFFSNRFNELEALGLYAIMSTGKFTMTSISKKYDVDFGILKNIKECKGSYSYIHDIYGYEPNYYLK